MAVGDAAGAAGLATYGDDLLVTDLDVALNQTGDYIAQDRDRLKTLEKQSIEVPKFFVKRSTVGQNITAEVWTQLTGSPWATPFKVVGDFGWSGGNLTVPRAGIYDVRAHVMFRNNDYRTVGINVTRNSLTPDSSASIAGNEWTGEAPDPGSSLQIGQTLAEYVALNQGDVLRVFVLQRNRGSDVVNIGDRTFDLSFNVMWVDSL